MLVLSRKRDEEIVIGDGDSPYQAVVSVVEVRGDKVRLGIEAPREVPVHRREIYDIVQRQRAEDAPPPSPPAPETTA